MRIIDAKLKAMRAFTSADSFGDTLIIFNSHSRRNQNVKPLVVTDYPVKFEVITIIFCKKGTMKIRLDCREYLIQERNYFTIMPGKISQVLEISDDYESEVICLKQDFFNYNNSLSKAVSIVNILNENPCHEIPMLLAAKFPSIFKQLKEKLNAAPSTFRTDIIYSYFNILFYEICDLLLNFEVKNIQTRGEDIFSRFIKEIEKHFRTERNVCFYADKIGLTPKYLSSVIHKQTGEHATSWIDKYTLLEAKALLKTSSMTIQQISYDLNFTTPSHFGRYFRRHTGLSPKEYRNS